MKAKDTQTWIRALRQVCRRPEVQAGDLADTLRVQALDSLSELYEVFAKAGIVPNDADASAALAAVKAFLRSCTALARWHINRGHCLYNSIFNFHLLHHIVYFGRWLNPRATWCYEWEDFVGKIKASAEMPLASTTMPGTPAKVLGNFLFGLAD